MKMTQKTTNAKEMNKTSDWSDSDDHKYSQVRGKPVVHDISSDQETDTDQPTTVAAPLRRPNTWPKVLICGRGRGKFPLANWTSVAKGHGCSNRHDISDAALSLNNQDPNTERNSTVIVPIDRVQTYQGELAPHKPRKELANWTSVRLGNPRAQINNTDIADQQHWQRHSNNNDNITLDGQQDNEESESIEGDQIHSEASKERPGRSLEDLE